MYINNKHKNFVEDRGYKYINSYKLNETTIDGKNKKRNDSYIRVKCPYCSAEYDIQLSGFKRGNKCNFCCNKYENSFAYHIQVELNESLNKYWDWDKNELNPYCITKNNSKKIWIKCTKTDYHGSYETTCSSFYNGNRCPYCSHASGKVHPKDSFAQWCIDNVDKDFMNRYWSDKNTVDPFTLSPSSGKKIWIKCQEKDYHNDNGGYETICSSFIKNHRCSYCHHFKIHPKESFGYLYPEKAKYWSKKNKKSPYEVSSKSSVKYKFICEKCGKEFERQLYNINRHDIGVICRECNSSELETTTREILCKYNINYEIQKKFNGLLGIGGGNLSYDFYLPNYNLLIECQGIQHEKFIKGLHSNEKDFERQQEHDKRKKQYAKDHNIKLLEIWYYESDNIENILNKEIKFK